MGMFDRVYMLDQSVDLKCAAGHWQTDVELQTKSLDEGNKTYLIFGGRLYVEDGSRYKTPRLKESNPEKLIRESQHTATLAPVSGHVTVYNDCDECDPICFESKFGGHWSDRVDAKNPWCEWELSVENGVIVASKPLRLETRDDVKRKWTEGTGALLPDDDRIVKRHVELHHRARLRGDN